MSVIVVLSEFGRPLSGGPPPNDRRGPPPGFIDRPQFLDQFGRPVFAASQMHPPPMAWEQRYVVFKPYVDISNDMGVESLYELMRSAVFKFKLNNLCHKLCYLSLTYVFLMMSMDDLKLFGNGICL